jgi:hypothetical protein
LLDKKGFTRTDAQKRRVQEIIARSKSVLTFVLDGLQASGTGDLTNDELFDGYVTYCQDHNWKHYPERQFFGLVRPIILRHFGVSQRHDVERLKPNGKKTSGRGYRGLEIKP